ncbi:MAG: calcium/sodium antiporter [Gammaproteobacteria bacterium]|nr:calcium/sodium antiporter [Gammaproteobacteria bacterium]
MLLALLAVVAGLIVLVWSADRFIDGAATTARYAGMPPLLIGMVIIGFGTSAPEMVVSAIAAMNGNPGLALGNAYGSNITNIALILGITALISPILVQSSILRRELPILTAVTFFAGYQLYDGQLSQGDAIALLGVFFALMGWTIWNGMRGRDDILASEVNAELDTSMSLRMAMAWLLIGLILLIASSRLLVWGAVSIAQSLGVSDLIIGLTIVAIGTSLPELASSVIAARKGEHDLALGNIIGSNLFNTLAVVGIAAAIHPLEVESTILSRDWMVMTLLTLSLFAMGYGFTRRGHINRSEGVVLILAFLAYLGWLVHVSLSTGLNG